MGDNCILMGCISLLNSYRDGDILSKRLHFYIKDDEDIEKGKLEITTIGRSSFQEIWIRFISAAFAGVLFGVTVKLFELFFLKGG